MSTNLTRRFLNTLCAECGSLLISSLISLLILVFIVDGCRRVRALDEVYITHFNEIFTFQFIRWSVIFVFTGNDFLFLSMIQSKC